MTPQLTITGLLDVFGVKDGGHVSVARAAALALVWRAVVRLEEVAKNVVAIDGVHFGLMLVHTGDRATAVLAELAALVVAARARSAGPRGRCCARSTT